ncbi:tRNA (guanosine(37)-N1)-methyltransferase TrmD [Buchnera aphidicola]|jgi:tRNA (guanine37-N1)-methyltransferase|uniref:tRNA (guanine-N(1)-)-methyltransferase n=1 Tax=Buchnera aphidicola subsp. Schizaphis graminum (strain Sg) TaxID=198804 RepID=TRMD_BUCAP|nr:tRNA (guanosine(37)-N1)-methyltransferase TrmD [Buchnera aphidicola]Q8K9F4.1 RecName: Full=tRNA (guanine-N(1)-)-methyltransferase; AltName: Full=M1G-methyltransferase; AltName: Full=tRNA [GM37] methyltransferase [Buchnera aphidicola str. Sg (Schizaphis graminum)]AAM67935.1 tRNA (guanine-n1)-methyltransferase [Buchnera aphidicola str. Sg (Schizaphis graminum)]AWI49573.1 tRNA (guanine(37)-N(1))-methyltransferase [Buchnera aphidicola (Schizaphis graminum)]
MELNKHDQTKTKYDNTLIWFCIITIFPEMFYAITNYGVTGKAIRKNIINIKFFNPRDFTDNKYKSVDDRPYGGGPGMLMSAKPLYLAIKNAKNLLKSAIVIYLSPQGKRLNQKKILEIIKNKKIIFVCGRYEGIDQRIIDCQVDEEWSIGDYILTGGELAAMVAIDSISRFIPGVIKKKQSVQEDSFFNGLLDYPHYTRPKIIEKMKVPEILLSGNHDKIRLWRLKKSLEKTWTKRPDLLKNKILKKEEKILLNELKKINKR